MHVALFFIVISVDPVTKQNNNNNNNEKAPENINVLFFLCNVIKMDEEKQ